MSGGASLGFLSTRSQRTSINALTGEVTVYNQTLAHIIYDHNEQDPDLNAVRDQINSDLAMQGVNAFCDGVMLYKMNNTDTLRPSIYVASASPIPALVALAVIAILANIKTILLLAGLIIIAFFLIPVLKELIYGTPSSYYTGDPDNPSPMSWSEYISYQNGHFWYVCSKDGSGWGDKALYPTVTSVPAAEVQAYQDHCASAPDISDKNANLIASLTTLIIIAGAVIIATKVAGPLLSAWSSRRSVAVT